MCFQQPAMIKLYYYGGKTSIHKIGEQYKKSRVIKQIL
jgi:hypothetical protein